MRPDIRSRRCVFVSHCVLAQCVMAEGIVKDFPGPIRPVVEFCLANDINIMQMPCPETLCSSGGLGRGPRGKKWYEEHGLRETARRIANEQAEYMATLIGQHFEILAIIGVEFSPACAVKFLNKGRSIHPGKGIYVEELERALSEHRISVPFIGVCQRWQKRMLEDLNALLRPV
jgi:predicted secreted protein